MTKAQKTFEKIAVDVEDATLTGAGTLAAGGVGYGGYKAYGAHQAAQKAKALRSMGGKAGLATAALAGLGGAGYAGLKGLRNVGGGSGRAGARTVADKATKGHASKYYDAADIAATNAYRNAQRSTAPQATKAKNLFIDLYSNFN